MTHPEYETERLGPSTKVSRPLSTEAFIQYVMADPARLGRIALTHLSNLQNVAGEIQFPTHGFKRPFAQ